MSKPFMDPVWLWKVWQPKWGAEMPNLYPIPMRVWLR